MFDLLLLESCGVVRIVSAHLGGSKGGLVGFRRLLRTCRRLWGARGDLVGAAMGHQEWGVGLAGDELWRAARRRHFWSKEPVHHYSVGLDGSWHGAYAFAVGLNGCAVFGRTASLVSQFQRNVCVWYVETATKRSFVRPITGCHRGHDLVFGHSDPGGGCVGQWVLLSFERVNGEQGVAMLNGNLIPIYEIRAPQLSLPPLRISVGEAGHYCVFNQFKCDVLGGGADPGSTHGELRRVRVADFDSRQPLAALGVAFACGSVYIVEERAISAAVLPVTDCHCVYRVIGDTFTGGVCALRSGICLLTKRGCVVWWVPGRGALRRVFSVEPQHTTYLCDERILVAMEEGRVAIVDRVGRVRVVSVERGAVEDDLVVACTPPQQIKVMSGPGGRNCVAVLRADCRLSIHGDAELCHVSGAI